MTAVEEQEDGEAPATHLLAKLASPIFVRCEVDGEATELTHALMSAQATHRGDSTDDIASGASLRDAQLRLPHVILITWGICQSVTRDQHHALIARDCCQVT